MQNFVYSNPFSIAMEQALKRELLRRFTPEKYSLGFAPEFKQMV